jgi:hypothetical protein
MNNEKVFENKKEDRSALKRYIVILIIAIIVGVIVGGVSNFVKESLTESIATGIMDFLTIIVPYANIVITIIGGILVVYLYKKSRNLFQVWDGENEEEINKVETILNYALWISSVVLIFSFFFFAVGVAVNIGDPIENKSWMDIILWFIGFFMAIIFTTITQQRIVNFEKEINPEKQGSIYDLNFQKKWIDSCDEAEQLNLYKSAYKSFRVVNITCLILWLFCVLGMYNWTYGLMPVSMVSIIWLVQTCSYNMETIRLAKHKNKK